MSSRVPRSRVVSARFTDAEHDALSQLAQHLGIDLSELIRRGALALTYPPTPTPDRATLTQSAPLVRVDWRTADQTPDRAPSVEGQHAQRGGGMKDRALNERWHAALLAAVPGDTPTDHVLREVIELHKPDGPYSNDECHADGANGYEWEHPEWPCETVGLIATALGMPMYRDCPVCHGSQMAEPDGTLTAHGRLVNGHSWDANCPGVGQVAEPGRATP